MSDEAVPPPSRSSGGAALVAPIEDGPRRDTAERLEVLAPGYLARVRRASGRLARRDDSLVDLVTALADVQDAAVFDIDAPTLSRLRIGRLVKLAVRKLTGWYLRYLTQQVAAFAAAVAHLGAMLIDRADRIEEANTAMAADLERLRQRVQHLEDGRSRGDGSPPA
jgi:hypothetical protein